jgi:hypothetical protein
MRGSLALLSLLLPALTCAVAGCSTTSGGTGTGNGNSQPPDAFVAATIGPAADGGSACAIGAKPETWLTLGIASAGLPMTVQDGASTGDGTASVSCTVKASGSGFDIVLAATVTGSQGGSVHIASPTGKGAVTTSGSSSLAVSFTSAQYPGTYTQSDCTLTFTYEGAPVSDYPPVAASPSHIWGHVSCPAAMKGTSTCDAEADFLFEYCDD